MEPLLAVVDVDTEWRRTLSSAVGGARGVRGEEDEETGPPLLGGGGERSVGVSGRGLRGCLFGEVWSMSSWLLRSCSASSPRAWLLIPESPASEHAFVLCS